LNVTLLADNRSSTQGYVSEPTLMLLLVFPPLVPAYSTSRLG
jgi:hypothetical protein